MTKGVRWSGLGKAVILLAIAASLEACSNSSSTAPTMTATSYTGTQRPGDLWTATFNSDGTFTASNLNATNALTFSGTTTALSSGFKRLTVISSSNEAKVARNAVGYAFEFPGTATFMTPPALSTSGVPNTPAVFLVAKAASAGFAANDTYNWVDIPSTLWSNTAGSNTRGNVTIQSITGTQITAVQNEFNLNNTQTTTNQSIVLTDLGSGQMSVRTNQGVCSGGTAHDATFTFQVSPSGAFMGDSTSNCGEQLSIAGAIGMKAPTASVNASLFSAGREFRGVLFRANPDITQKEPYTEQIWGTITLPTPPATTPTFVGGNIDVETGTKVQNVTIALGNEDPSHGLYPSATITDPGATQPAVFMVNQVGGKYFVFGIADNTTSNPTRPFNFMLIEQ